MFRNSRYVTRGVTNTASPPLQLLLWYLIDTMEVEQMDYLQVFELEPEGDHQKIIHTQEEPNYRKEYSLNFGDKPIQAKIFAIDDGDHSTMLLAEEY